MQPSDVSITVPLTDKERRALEDLADMQELPPWRVMIQALRHYQVIVQRARRGETLGFYDMAGNRIIDPIFPGELSD